MWIASSYSTDNEGVAKVSWVEHAAERESQRTNEISHFGFIDQAGNMRFSWSLEYPEAISPNLLDGSMRSFINGEHL